MKVIIVLAALGLFWLGAFMLKLLSGTNKAEDNSKLFAAAHFSYLMKTFSNAWNIPLVQGVPSQIRNASLTIADMVHQVGGQTSEIKDSDPHNFMASSVVAIQAAHVMSRLARLEQDYPEEKLEVMETLPLAILKAHGDPLPDQLVRKAKAMTNAYLVLSSPQMVHILQKLDAAIQDYFVNPEVEAERKVRDLVECRAEAHQALAALT